MRVHLPLQGRNTKWHDLLSKTSNSLLDIGELSLSFVSLSKIFEAATDIFFFIKNKRSSEPALAVGTLGSLLIKFIKLFGVI